MNEEAARCIDSCKNALLDIEQALSVGWNERADDGGLWSGLELSIQQIETGLVTSSSAIW